MNKYFVIVVSFLAVALIGSQASGEELRAKLDCKNGICIPVGSGTSAADLAKVRALAARAAKLKKAIDEVDGRDRSRVDQFIEEVNRLRKDVDNLKQDRDAAGSVLAGTSYQAAGAERLAKEARGGLGRLAKDVSVLQTKLKAVTAIATAKRPAINFEVGGVGFGAYPFGAGGGLLASLVIPMGSEGLWDVRLSGGLGVTGTPGLGWLADVSLTRKIGKKQIVSIGPAIVAMGDEGNLTGGNKWVFGGGLEIRVKLASRLALVATPFIGVSVKDKSEYIGSGWADSVSRTDCYTSSCGTWCHTKILREAGMQDYYDITRDVVFAAGGTLALTVSMF